MKKIKTLIPVISAFSIAGIVAPTITSCSNVVTLEIAYHDGKVYEYSTSPIKWEQGALDPQAAIQTYFDAINENRRILLDDFYSIITSDASRLNYINFLKMIVREISNTPSQYRMTIDWNVNYNSYFELHPTCTYVTNVRMVNFPFIAGKATDPTTLLPLDKGVQIKPLTLDELRNDNDWQIEYYYEESSPVGLLSRTYIYNSETITSPYQYPIEGLTLYVLPMITYNSRYLQEVPVSK